MQPISYTTINLTLPSPLVLPCPLPGVARDFCVLFALYIFLLCPLRGVTHGSLGASSLGAPRQQYEDGTTDVTRTMHFGEATAEQKEVCVKHALE